MKIKHTLILLLCLQVSTLAADSVYAKYRNQKYAYSISYPSALLFPQGEADSGDGQIFLSKEAQITLRCWGRYGLDESLETRYKSVLNEAKNRSAKTVITYKSKRNSWFVVSGVDNTKKIIFYRKVFLINEMFKECLISYPESRKKEMNGWVVKIFERFNPI